jgi:hypothetical protein
VCCQLRANINSFPPSNAMRSRRPSSRVACIAALVLSMLGAVDFGTFLAEARSMRSSEALSESTKTRTTAREASKIGDSGNDAAGGDVEPQPGSSQTDSEMCVGCQFVWDRTNNKLDQSAGYEDTKGAFERTCADMPNVFFDACDAMFEKEDQMVQDYLSGAKFEDMCANALMCLSPAL